MIHRSKFVRLAFVLLLVTGGIAAVFAYRASRQPDQNAEFCAGGPACLQYMTISASFDALPLKIQKVLRGYSGNTTGYEYLIGDDGQTYIELINFADNNATRPRRRRYYSIQMSLKNDEGFELTDLNNRLSSAKPGYRGSSACDLQNPSRLLGLNETKVRRCLRAFYLSLYAPEFNERTRKLFSDVNVEYSDGTMGPILFLRPKLTDSDLSKMVSAMERFDKKARTLGGYR